MKDAAKKTKPNQLSTVKKAILTIEKMQEKIAELENLRSQPIAIVGMGCRYPEDMNNPNAFWTFLKEEKEAIKKVPVNRWTSFSDHRDLLGEEKYFYGSFISDIDKFDYSFFGLTKREAKSMDPQHRLLLEVCWQAIQDAGYSFRQLSELKTGVFVGITTNDYAQEILQNCGYNDIDSHFAIGNALNAAAGRIAYHFNLRGPCMAIDTACSSSLVSVHLACQSLRSGESDLAIVGGVNLILSPIPHIALAKAHALSTSGHCQAFADGADGYVRGEGCGILILKPLSKALKEGDRILATIIGSAIAHDGASSGFTVPKGKAQQAVMEEALKNAKILPSSVDYIEAHGTGTPLGDPVEVAALQNVYGMRDKDNLLWIGSVKTNIGHLESAAGITSIIKIVLALQHERIPAQLHTTKMNTRIPWNDISLKVIHSSQPWIRHADKRRIAGVSGFGFSGTNAHILISDFSETSAVSNIKSRDAHILTISAKSLNSLVELVNIYIKFLDKIEDQDIADICYASNIKREHFSYRLAVVANNKANLLQELKRKVNLLAQQPIDVERKNLSTIAFDLKEENPNWPDLLEKLGFQYEEGADIDWQQISSDYGYYRLNLPFYPLNSERVIALEGKISKQNQQSWLEKRHVPGHKLTVYTSLINLETMSFMSDHKVFGRIVVPGGFHIAYLVEIANRHLSSKHFCINNLFFQQVMLLIPNSESYLQAQLTHSTNDEADFKIVSHHQDEENYLLHASGCFKTTTTKLVCSEEIIQKVKRTIKQQPYLTQKAFYEMIAANSKISHGESFQWNKKFWKDDNWAVSTMCIPENINNNYFILQPGLIDSCFQVLGLYSILLQQLGEAETAVPYSIKKIVWDFSSRINGSLYCYVESRDSSDGDTTSGDIYLLNDCYQPVAIFYEFSFKKTNQEKLLRATDLDSSQSRANIKSGPDSFDLIKFKGLDKVERQMQLLDVLSHIFREITDSEVEKIEVDQRIDSLGLDSLMGAEIEIEIKERLSISLSIVNFLQGQTIRDLVNYIDDQLQALDIKSIKEFEEKKESTQRIEIEI